MSAAEIIFKEVSGAMIEAGFRAEDDCIKSGVTRADRISQIYAAMEYQRRHETKETAVSDLSNQQSEPPHREALKQAAPVYRVPVFRAPAHCN